MKCLLLAALFSAAVAAPASCAWWMENDYSTGSNGHKRNSLTVFTKLSPRFVAGANAAFYKDTADYRKKLWSFRLPVMYSGNRISLSLKPFIYPVSSETRSGARGAKLYLLTSLAEPGDESYLRITVSGAWAEQEARVAGGAAGAVKTFSQATYELQAEKSFFGQFYFLASAAGFAKPSGLSGLTPVKPAMDQSELAYLGTFRQVTALPEWTMGMQIARNMRPDFDSHIYAGYSRISLRKAGVANSGTAGLKLGLNERATLDLAYNLYKHEDEAWKNYYKILLQIFF